MISAEANARIKHEKLMDEISWEVPAGDEDVTGQVSSSGFGESLIAKLAVEVPNSPRVDSCPQFGAH